MASLIDELKAHLNAAKGYGNLSYSKRLKVGALLVKDGRPLTNGRNGMVSGGSNVCEDEDGNTLPTVIHAEKNAIAFAAAEGVATKGTTLVCTHSPCMDCATLIKQAKIKEVYYETEYRDTEPINFLRKAGVYVERF